MLTHVKRWANMLNSGDPSLRQLLVATANVVSYAWVLWVPCKSESGTHMSIVEIDMCSVVLFPTYDCPKYIYGYQTLILFGGLAILSVTLMWYLYRRRE